MNSLPALDTSPFLFLNFLKSIKFLNAAADFIPVCNPPFLASFFPFLPLFLPSFFLLSFAESSVVAARLVAGEGSVEDGRWQANDWVWRGAAAETDGTLATGSRVVRGAPYKA